MRERVTWPTKKLSVGNLGDCATKLVRSHPMTPTIRTIQMRTDRVTVLGWARQVRTPLAASTVQSCVVRRWRRRPSTTAEITATAMRAPTLQWAAGASRDSCACQAESAAALPTRRTRLTTEVPPGRGVRRSREARGDGDELATRPAYRRWSGRLDPGVAYDPPRARDIARGRSPIGRGRALKPPPVRVRIPPSPLWARDPFGRSVRPALRGVIRLDDGRRM
jgi:hypothetical protein